MLRGLFAGLGAVIDILEAPSSPERELEKFRMGRGLLGS